MNPDSRVAYKEWASVTEALARGLFVMSLRKGGIHEKQGEFSVEHREYFLFPTYLHQRESDLAPAVLPLLAETKAHAPAEGAEGGQIALRYYATVERAVYLDDLKTALALDGQHPFTAAAVEARFKYKKPGLWVIVERLYALPEARLIENHRLYAGCRSWVPLNETILTAGARPVLGDEEFSKRLKPAPFQLGRQISFAGPAHILGPMEFKG